MVLNIKTALANVEGDEDLLLELAALFCRESPKSLAALRQAAARRDFGAVRAAAHGLKGAVGTFAALDAMDAAASLEAVARANDATGLPEASAALQERIEELRSALQNLGNDLHVGSDPCL
jgi:HPt (histidine-containing phosphotransfer) domain-containing protein